MKRGWMLLASVVSSMWLGSGCVESQTFTCETPTGLVTCAGGNVCLPTGCAGLLEVTACRASLPGEPCQTANGVGFCVAGACTLSVCGNGQLDVGERCDDGNRQGGDGCAADCSSSERCGDGVLDRAIGEECDDGNQDAFDGCHNDCRVPRCGDAVLDGQLGEACDEGLQNSDAPNAACRVRCQPARCGDGVVDAVEICDDGNLDSGDGCAGDCGSLELCGNGIVDVNEACDDGNQADDDQCDARCRLPRCGNEVVDTAAGEACDAGLANSDLPDAPCRANCQLPRCGDGIKDSREVCDDGNLNDGDGCSASCTSTELCGNGIVDVTVGEQCDDATPTLSNDGCSSRCLLEYPVWQSMVTTDAPRRKAAAVYHVARGRLVRAAGETRAALVAATSTYEGQTWARPPLMVEPPPREGAAMAYDARARHAVLFAGMSVEGLVADTWVLDAQRWTRLTSAVAPAARHEHAMAYHDGLAATVLFGGDASGVLGDTWMFRDASWHRLTPALAPSPRWGHAMAYDARRAVIVMAGGRADDGSYLDDVWEFDGVTWRPRNDALLPAARAAHAMTYHPTTGEVWLIGGQGAGGSLADAWAFDGVVWQVRAPLPAPRVGSAFAYDAFHGRLVVSGGQLTDEPLMETLEFDGEGWVGGASWPPARFHHGMAFDARRQRLVLYGGVSDTLAGRSDTWEFDGRMWRERLPTSNPGPRSSFAMAYDPLRQRIVVIGGYLNHEGGARDALHDAWEYDGVNWLQTDTAVHGAGPNATLTYDSQREKLILLTTAIDSGTEAFTLEHAERGRDGVWQEVNNAVEPPLRKWFNAGFHEGRRRLLFWGGLDASGVMLRDVWEYNNEGWIQKSVGPATIAAAFAYDTANERMVQFGGVAADGTLIAQTYLHGPGAFSLATVESRPIALTGAAMGYGFGKVWLMGGFSALDGGIATNVLYQLSGAQWLPIRNASQPQAGDGGELLDLAEKDAMLYWGGEYVFSIYRDQEQDPLNEAWLLRGDQWEAQPQTLAPAPRSEHMMAYDSVRGVVVLFGGVNLVGRLADTWEWDGRGWRRMAPVVSPPLREQAAMAFDPVRRVTVLFGGLARGALTSIA